MSLLPRRCWCYEMAGQHVLDRARLEMAGCRWKSRKSIIELKVFSEQPQTSLTCFHDDTIKGSPCSIYFDLVHSTDIAPDDA
jgi:hypothetical protein